MDIHDIEFVDMPYLDPEFVYRAPETEPERARDEIHPIERALANIISALLVVLGVWWRVAVFTWHNPKTAATTVMFTILTYYNWRWAFWIPMKILGLVYGITFFEFSWPRREEVVVVRYDNTYLLALVVVQSFLNIWLYFRRVTVETLDGPERVLPGSDFMGGSLTPFMAWIQIKVAAGWHTVGCGFRTAEGFVTAAHVVSSGDLFRISTGEKSVEVGKDDFICDDHEDLACIRDYTKFRSLGLKAANWGSMEGKQTVMVTDGKKTSMGLLEDSGTGYVDYHGSTVKGFSGAPYYMANRVFGMHMGAAGVNKGIDGAYLQVLLNYGPESSEDLMSLMKRKVRHTKRVSPYDPDEYLVKVRGKYHRIDRDEYDRMWSGESLNVAPRVNFDDADRLNWESPAPVYGLAGQNRGVDVQHEGQPITGATRCQCHGSGPPMSTAPQTSTHVPRKEASPTMLPLTQPLPLKPKRLKKKKKEASTSMAEDEWKVVEARRGRPQVAETQC